MKLGKLSHAQLSVVAIPAHNEASYIAGCLAALALQRDEAGAPIEQGSLEVLIFANNCSDETVSIARQAVRAIPHPVSIVEEHMPRERLNAGWARKRAMDLAAIRLAEVAPIRGLILKPMRIAVSHRHGSLRHCANSKRAQIASPAISTLFRPNILHWAASS